MTQSDQFAVASALLEAHGGRRECAWAVAGELLEEHPSFEALFLALGNLETAERVRQANEAARLASR